MAKETFMPMLFSLRRFMEIVFNDKRSVSVGVVSMFSTCVKETIDSNPCGTTTLAAWVKRLHTFILHV